MQQKHTTRQWTKKNFDFFGQCNVNFKEITALLTWNFCPRFFFLLFFFWAPLFLYCSKSAEKIGFSDQDNDVFGAGWRWDSKLHKRVVYFLYFKFGWTEVIFQQRRFYRFLRRNKFAELTFLNLHIIHNIICLFH